MHATTFVHLFSHLINSLQSTNYQVISYSASCINSQPLKLVLILPFVPVFIVNVSWHKTLALKI